jgi:2'-5' RNA ligase
MPNHFFALCPDAPAAARLESLGHDLAERCGGKPVPRARIHLTLAFLGSIDAGRAIEAQSAGAALPGAAFDVAFDVVGWFKGARVAWAGCSNPAPALVELQQRLAVALRRGGFVLDDRPYTPHLTLVRKVARPVARAAIAPIGWPATQLRLMRTEAGRYATLASWELS